VGCTIIPWWRLGGPSHNPSGIPGRTIAEGEIIACGINCPVAEAKWTVLAKWKALDPNNTKIDAC